MTAGRARTVVLTQITVPWWVLLVLGVLWLVFAMLVLQFDLTSARTIALAAGLLLVVAAFSQLVTAQAARRWRWVHFALAGAFFVAGMAALVWPDPTFLVLARLVAWFLLFKGCADLLTGFVARADEAFWWLFLVVGLAEIAVAFWAAGSTTRSAALLVLWVGVVALAKGVTDIALAFGLRTPERA
ncbi:MAG TPA: DUF308 domain-containing protein [Amycolatopsis sp.]|uniref:HdeD family acid-resistance protein n=1 Tax=Amycolatopsis sp. TaxID=37632 RepID=UPI002B471F8A|nr:DUF308 domain-containing protein [Amycolatopsis sp.]HKS49657.1 DUF308 domain-containing protein [Amycolatopsis sp.]